MRSFPIVLLAISSFVQLAGAEIEKSRRPSQTIRPAADDEQMVLIPAGEFRMGRNDRRDAEKPVHKMYVDAFLMDKHEVTNRRYRKFLEATRHRKPKYWNNPRFNRDEQPVMGVNWNDAVAFCAWAGKRLPTEAEWEKAARGGLEGKEYSWGNENPKGRACCELDSDKGQPQAVGSYPPNGYGLFDMTGNVCEWCSDWFGEDYYKASPSKNPAGPLSGTSRVIRGGAWYDYCTFSGLRCTLRCSRYPTTREDDLGFRCVKSAR
jgi:formylglycine-generating enzyme